MARGVAWGLIFSLALWAILVGAALGLDWLWHHVLIPWLAQP